MTIHIYKTTSQNKLETIDKIEDGCWVRIYSSSEDELEKLSEEQNIPLDFLIDSLDQNEVARLEIKNDCILIIFQSPFLQNPEEDNVDYRTTPYGMIVKQDTLYTISKEKIKLLTNFVNYGNLDISVNNKKGMVLEMLQNTSNLYLNSLKKINERHESIEKNMFDTKDSQFLMELQHLKKSLVYFTTAIKSNLNVLGKLKRNTLLHFNEEELDLLEDVGIDLKQALDLSEIYTNIIVGTLHTFTSLISNDISNVMKFLTSVTIILMIPNLVSGIYGMNIEGLPFAKDHHAFLILIFVCTALSAIFSYLFFKNNWFRR